MKHLIFLSIILITIFLFPSCVSYLEKSEDYKVQSKSSKWINEYGYSWSPYFYDLEGATLTIGNNGNKRILSGGPTFLPIFPQGNHNPSHIEIYLDIKCDSGIISLDLSNISIKTDSSTNLLPFSVRESRKDTGFVSFKEKLIFIQKGEKKGYTLRMNASYDSLQCFTVNIGTVFMNNHEVSVPEIEFIADPSMQYIPFVGH